MDNDCTNDDYDDECFDDVGYSIPQVVYIPSNSRSNGKNMAGRQMDRSVHNSITDR